VKQAHILYIDYIMCIALNYLQPSPSPPYHHHHYHTNLAIIIVVKTTLKLLC